MSAQLRRLQRRFSRIPVAVREAAQASLRLSGEELAETMRALAPEDEGDLKGSIAVTPGGQATPPYSQPGGSTIVPENGVMVTAGNADVRYPHLVEHGTEHAAAQPFFWPAFRIRRKRILNRTKRAIRKAIRETRG
ncbi:MAG: HK97-gp10 family putative phage morphogenesis protein [Salinarimonas sp.]